jgi:hypothetical protein
MRGTQQLPGIGMPIPSAVTRKSCHLTGSLHAKSPGQSHFVYLVSLRLTKTDRPQPKNFGRIIHLVGQQMKGKILLLRLPSNA